MKTNKSNYKTIGSTNDYFIKECPVCGRPIPQGMGYYIGQTARQLGLNSNASYIHIDCKERGAYYHANRDNETHGSKTSSCYRHCLYGLEIELDHRTEAFEYLQGLGWNGERDGSLSEDGLEWKHGIMKSFSHYSKVLHGLEKFDEVYSVSTHFTISTGNPLNDIKVLDFIRHYRKSIVNYLQEVIIRRGNVAEYFGRNFVYYADKYTEANGEDNEHRRWINLSHTNNGSIEFRLNKFNGSNATQLIQTMKFERDFYLICCEAFEKHGKTREAVSMVRRWIDKNVR